MSYQLYSVRKVCALNTYVYSMVMFLLGWFVFDNKIRRVDKFLHLEKIITNAFFFVNKCKCSFMFRFLLHRNFLNICISRYSSDLYNLNVFP
jgi:hypothetical protein